MTLARHRDRARRSRRGCPSTRRARSSASRTGPGLVRFTSASISGRARLRGVRPRGRADRRPRWRPSGPLAARRTAPNPSGVASASRSRIATSPSPISARSCVPRLGCRLVGDACEHRNIGLVAERQRTPFSYRGLATRATSATPGCRAPSEDPRMTVAIARAPNRRAHPTDRRRGLHDHRRRHRRLRWWTSCATRSAGSSESSTCGRSAPPRGTFDPAHVQPPRQGPRLPSDADPPCGAADRRAVARPGAACSPA